MFLVDNRSALVQSMVWWLAGDKPLPELRMTRFIDEYMHHGRRIYTSPSLKLLTRLGWVMHICVSKLTIIGSDNVLSPSRHQTIIWTTAGVLLIGLLRTNFSGIFIEIYIFSSKKMHLKLLSGKWRSFCLGIIVLKMVSKIHRFVRWALLFIVCTALIHRWRV